MTSMTSRAVTMTLNALVIMYADSLNMPLMALVKESASEREGLSSNQLKTSSLTSKIASAPMIPAEEMGIVSQAMFVSLTPLWMATATQKSAKTCSLQ